MAKLKKSTNRVSHKPSLRKKIFLRFSALSFLRKTKQYSKLKQAKVQADLDKKLVYSLAPSKVPTWRQLKHIDKVLSHKEKQVLKISGIIFLVSVVFLFVRFYVTHLTVVPARGGEYTEAFVGTPKLINPLYAVLNDVDNDISVLIFSSLFKRGKNGELINDLVKDYKISDDNKEYVFTIRDDVNWHNGNKLTTDDILFTFRAITDPQYKSPLRSSFVGVKIEKIDDYSFKFILSDPYAAFLELLTFGILPSKEWLHIMPENATLAELNLAPIGSGPYRIDKRLKDSNGEIHEYFLAINDEYYGQKPYLNFHCVFFPGFEEAIAALNDRKVDGISYLPDNLRENILTPKAFNYHNLYFPQLKAIFFNQETNKALLDKSLRQALAYAIDRNDIINKITGKAYLVDGPILPNSFAYWPKIKKYNYNPEMASQLLDSVNWKIKEISVEDIITKEKEINDQEEKNDEEEKKLAILKSLGPGRWREKDGNYLIINLTTVDSDENEQVVSLVKEYWEKQGIKTIVNVVPGTRIQNEIIKPRAFTALFYSLIIGADPDPYAFWHSSQAQKNGFNIAGYQNKEVDQLLEEARLTNNRELRKEKYKRFQEIISEEEPAIFMYSPAYTYIQDNRVKGFAVLNISSAADRFSNISDWYIKTGKKLTWRLH